MKFILFVVILIASISTFTTMADNSILEINLAVCNGNTEKIKFLLTNGVDINVEDESGYTPIFMAINFDKDESLNILIKNGAKVNQIPNDDGPTPLISAIQRESIKSITLLTKGGADPNLSVRGHITPLLVAIETDNYQIVKHLIDAGAEKDDVFGEDRKTYYDIARLSRKSQEILELLKI